MIQKTELANYRDTLSNSIYSLTSKPLTEVNPNKAGILRQSGNNIALMPKDTISAVHIARNEQKVRNIAILNFADFKRAGGRFLDGSLAQEEAICYCTNLYPELARYQTTWYEPHRKCMHYGAYENQSLLSHNVSVVAKGIGDFLPASNFFSIDVLTCAAPNWTLALRYKSVPMEVMYKATQERIDYVMRIFSSGEYDEVIIGAFGCGVFKNDPAFVAQCFASTLNKYQFKHITCAIPDANSETYKTFRRVFASSLI